MEQVYLERSVDKKLLEWKDSSDRKPLLVRGARQVGKSWAVRHLGKTFKYFLEVNFEKDKEVLEFFNGNMDVKRIASQLSDYFNVPVIPGETLLFLDEIQKSENVIHSLWFFKEDYRELHVIGAGSLLEFALKEQSSFGVGRIDSLFVYPMSFDEFLDATGNSSLVRVKKKASPEHPLMDAFYNKLVEAFRSFILVGGMPEAVSIFAATGSYRKSGAVVSSIIQGYQDDFSKYAKKVDPTLLRQTLLSVARQIGDKFVYSHVEGNYRSYEVKKALEMLCDAGLIIPTYHTDANGIPLGAEINEKIIKYVMLDSGVVLGLLGIEDDTDELVKEIMVASSTDLVDKGHLSEMVAGTELVKYMSPDKKHQLYYWQNTAKGTISEVDYIIAHGKEIIPIEVKSGVRGSMASMYVLMKNPQKNINSGIRCSLENFGKFLSPGGKPVRIIPLYAISNIFEDRIIL